jgi:predicted membrane channel-forming protein YqfA (hemolysin III family)
MHNAWDTVTDKVMVAFSIILPFVMIALLVLAPLGALVSLLISKAWLSAACLVYVFAMLLQAFLASVDWHYIAPKKEAVWKSFWR